MRHRATSYGSSAVALVKKAGRTQRRLLRAVLDTRPLAIIATAALVVSVIAVPVVEHLSARQHAASIATAKALSARAMLSSANPDPCDGDASSTQGTGGTETGDVPNWLSDPADYLGTECPEYATFLGEYFGGTNPALDCLRCADAALAAYTGSADVSSGDPVNTLDGDLIQTYNEFSIPAVGNALSFSLTYDAQAAQQQVIGGVTSAGMFGWGWSGGYSASLHTFTSATSNTGPSYSYVSITEGNGSQVTFIEGSWSGSTRLCPSILSPSEQPYVPRTVAGSANVYCAAPDVIAQLGYSSSTQNWTYELSGGKQIYTFQSNGTLEYEGNAINPEYTSFTNSGVGGICPSTAPGPSTTAPSVSITQCTIITNLPGQAGARSIVLAFDSAGQVAEVLDPMGNPYVLSYDTSGNLTEIQSPSPGGSGAVTRSFAYEGGTSSLAHDMVSTTGPRGNTTTFSWLSHVSKSTGITTAQVSSEQAPTSPSDSVGSNSTTSFSYTCNIACNVGGATQSTTTTYPDGSNVVDYYESGTLRGTTHGPPTCQHVRTGVRHRRREPMQQELTPLCRVHLAPRTWWSLAATTERATWATPGHGTASRGQRCVPRVVHPRE